MNTFTLFHSTEKYDQEYLPYLRQYNLDKMMQSEKKVVKSMTFLGSRNLSSEL